MSSILDALRKSEAERQRGQLPTLGGHLPAHRQPAPKRRRVWILPALAVVAIAAAWFGGLFQPGGETPPTAVEQTEVASTEQAPARAEMPAEVGVAPPSDEDGSTIAATESAADGVPPVGRPRGRGGFGPFPPSTQAQAEAEAARLAAAEEAAATPVAPLDPAVAVAPPPAAEIPVEIAPEPVPPATATEPGTPATAPTTAPAPAQAATASAASGSVPEIYQLPFAFRRTLPAIAVTMHMYNADPERRFALINGQRARDGQPLEGGLEVVAIRADGIVLRYEGTEFLHPIRP